MPVGCRTATQLTSAAQGKALVAKAAAGSSAGSVRYASASSRREHCARKPGHRRRCGARLPHRAPTAQISRKRPTRKGSEGPGDKLGNGRRRPSHGNSKTSVKMLMQIKSCMKKWCNPLPLFRLPTGHFSSASCVFDSCPTMGVGGLRGRSCGHPLPPGICSDCCSGHGPACDIFQPLLLVFPGQKASDRAGAASPA